MKSMKIHKNWIPRKSMKIKIHENLWKLKSMPSKKSQKIHKTWFWIKEFPKKELWNPRNNEIPRSPICNNESKDPWGQSRNPIKSPKVLQNILCSSLNFNSRPIPNEHQNSFVFDFSNPFSFSQLLTSPKGTTHPSFSSKNSFKVQQDTKTNRLPTVSNEMWHWKKHFLFHFKTFLLYIMQRKKSKTKRE